MGSLARWAGLAGFCIVLGFVGSLGGLWVMHGHLHGERGPAGEPGVAGPVGPKGPRGSAGKVAIPSNVAHLDNVLRNLETGQNDLSDKIAALEDATGLQPATVDQSCVPTKVVTDVQWNRFDQNFPLNVSTAMICLSVR